MAYSLDFRQKILEAYLGKEGTNQEIAQRFKISISTVKRIGQRYRETGSINLHLSNIGHSSKIDESAQKELKKIIKDKPGATLKEIRQALKQRSKIEVTLPAIHYVLKKLTLSYKKKSMYASQRDCDEVKKRAEFIEEIKEKSIDELLFLDEAGAHLAMSRSYGRCARNERLVYSCPYARGSHYSMISTISVHEVTAAMYTAGAIDGEVFIHFLEHYLAPKLQPNYWVILDNVAFHKVKGVKEIIESTGAKVKYLPPYSPDLSPIELMWSKVKSCLKALEARCKNTFQAAMHEAFNAVKSCDLRNWYKNCGYTGSIII